MVSDTVIAKFSLPMICVQLGAVFATLLACWVLVLRHPAGTAALEYAWATDKVLVIVTFVFTPLAMWRCAAIIGQTMYHGARAIWIEDGRLRYLAYGNASFSDVPPGNVQDISIKTASFTGPTRIAIRMKDKVDYVTAFFLADPAPVVHARLAEALSLTQAS